MSHVTRVTLLVVVLIYSNALPGVVRAEVPRGRLQLEVSSDFEVVSGTVHAAVHNVTGAPIAEVHLWLPFNRLAEPPDGMDQRNAHWIYPRAFAPGSIEITRLTCDGRESPADSMEFRAYDRPGLGDDQRILATVTLSTPLQPGARVAMEIHFRTTVPRRFGRLGRTRNVLTLAGGFYPQVAALTPTGWQLDAPLIDQEWDVDLVAPGRAHVVMNEHYVIAPDDGTLRLQLQRAPYIALVIARRLHRSQLQVGDVSVEYLSLRPRYRPPEQERGLREPLPADVGDATQWDWQGRALGAARGTLQTLQENGISRPPGSVVRFVEVPLRLELVSPIPFGVLVSDRTYRITPLEQFYRFHDLQIARAVGWLVLEQAVLRESDADRGWARDLLASAVADAFAHSQYGGRGPGLRRLLRIGAFIPEIDQILYSPLIQFRHLFLRPFIDEDPVRDELWRMASTWPRGAVLHDKLVDLLGADTVQDLLARYWSSETQLRELVDDGSGEPMDWFFQQWLDTYPSVNYRLGETTSEPRSQGGFRHQIEIERQGDSIREPVEVRLHYADGRQEDVTWDGRGARGTVTAESSVRLSRVEIDPRRRLLEDSQLAGQNARFDNISPPRWRIPVLNSLLLYLNATEGNWYALVDFSLRRQFDARQAIRLRLEYDPRGISGELFYRYGFGPLLHLDSASWFISTGVSVLRTLGDFAGSGVDATAFGANVSLYHDTRWYRYDPMEGWGFRLTLFGSGSVTDDSVWGWTFGTSGRLAGHWTPRVGHTFTGYLGAGILIGEPLPQQLFSISDRFMLRAFEADETIGRVRIYGGIEYRWTMIHNLNINLLHLAWLRSIALVAFAAGGTASQQDGLDGLFTGDRMFTEVGGGVRALLDIAGVQPYIIAVDIAYPITPRERLRCSQEGECVARNPIGVYVSIQHTM